jgi:hypothetical protein
MEKRMHMGNQMFVVRMFLRANKHLAHYGRALDNVLASRDFTSSNSSTEFNNVLERIATFTVVVPAGSLEAAE